MAHPEAQRRAHEEIDRVVGSDRLPTYDDLDQMPYIKAFILERMYWYVWKRPGSPEMLAKDYDSFLPTRKYKNYRIPSGSMIFTNYWSISRDPALFDDPEKFMPERYIQHPQGFGKALRSQLEQQGSDDIGYLKLWPSVAFGIGKASKKLYRSVLDVCLLDPIQRRCTGTYLAHALVDLATVRLLWAFNFDKPRDPSGKPINVDIWNDKPGILGAPFPFDCDINARSPKHAELIRQGYRDAAPILEPFEQELCEADREWVAASRVD
ncbi:hypothetical protein FRC00_004396 [Tulasnella sp. 408]|nr:hypothetical protein FRC00_004396 [Tulasnella sp. 408]